jgi:hypothetical protein
MEKLSDCGRKTEWKDTHHLIRKDPVQLIVIQTNHPLQPLQLIILQLATNEYARLLRDLLRNSMGNCIIIDLAPVLVGVVHARGTKSGLACGGVFGLEHHNRRVTVNIVILLGNDGLGE